MQMSVSGSESGKSMRKEAERPPRDRTSRVEPEELLRNAGRLAACNHVIIFVNYAAPKVRGNLVATLSDRDSEEYHFDPVRDFYTDFLGWEYVSGISDLILLRSIL